MDGCLGSILGVILWAGICAVIGGIVAGMTDTGIFFWVISIPMFIIGLISILIREFLSGIFHD